VILLLTGQRPFSGTKKRRSRHGLQSVGERHCSVLLSGDEATIVGSRAKVTLQRLCQLRDAQKIRGLAIQGADFYALYLCARTICGRNGGVMVDKITACRPSTVRRGRHPPVGGFDPWPACVAAHRPHLPVACGASLTVLWRDQ